MADLEVVSLWSALAELIERFETRRDGSGLPAVDLPATGLARLEPGRFEATFAAGRTAQAQLPFELAPSGRVAMVCAEPLIPWLAACGWALEAARAGATVTVACPGAAHSMAALFVALGSSLSWRNLDHYRFDAVDWKVMVAAIEHMAGRDVTFVRGGGRRSSSGTLAYGAARGGIVVTHPDDGLAAAPAPTSTLVLHAVAAPWPPGRLPAGPTGLRACGGAGAAGCDQVIGVGMFDPFDGVLIGEASPADPAPSRPGPA